MIGGYLPLVPLGIFTFLIPVIVIVWILLNKTTFGRRVYAAGTNDTAASGRASTCDRTACSSTSSPA